MFAANPLLFYRQFEMEYSQWVSNAIEDFSVNEYENDITIETFLSVGLDPNALNTNYEEDDLEDWPESFFQRALETKHMDTIRLFLRYGAQVEQLVFPWCSNWKTASEPNTVLCFLMNYIGVENLINNEDMDILKLIINHSSNPIDYINRPCSECKHTLATFIQHDYTSCKIKTDVLYTLVQMGLKIEEDVASVFQNALLSSHAPMCEWILKKNIRISELNVWDGIMNRIPKALLVDMIERLDKLDSIRSKPLKRNLLHAAILMGDSDIILHLLSKPYAPIWLRETDTKKMTPLQLAWKQGLVLNIIILFQHSLHYETKHVTKHNKNARHFKSKWRKQFIFAQHAFYDFLSQQLNQQLVRLNPTKEHETTLNMLGLLIEDFYHPSGIGKPDGNIILLKEMEYDENMVREWVKTNPLAAMRYYYAYTKST